tara:strand:- start:852 stop:1811 length:960 start_codon:yes stop_codon:yes gene_type:complete
MNIALLPTSGKLSYVHYINTIENPISFDRLKRNLDPDSKNKLEKFNLKKFHLWGVTNGHKNRNLNLWQSLNPGDKCIFYRKKKFFSKGVIALTVKNKDISNQLWGRGSNGELWENLIFIKSLEKENIDIQEFNETMEYSEKNVLQAFQVVSADKLSKIFSKEFDAQKNSSRSIHYQRKLEKITGETDLDSISKTRAEQKILSDYLFENSKYSACAICSKQYPNQLLVAGHIKKRKEATKKERLDLSIVMPVCKLGCDELFEHGYIYVDENNILKKNLEKDGTIELDHVIEKLIDKKIEYVNENNKRYFYHHRKKMKQGS